MKRKSPLTVTYKDLVKWAGAQVFNLDARINQARGSGVTGLDGMIHSLHCAKQLQKMLKAGEPDKQTDMFELYNQVNK